MTLCDSLSFGLCLAQGHYFSIIQVIKTFSTREGWWYIGIKGDGGVKSKGTRLLIEKEK